MSAPIEDVDKSLEELIAERQKGTQSGKAPTRGNRQFQQQHPHGGPARGGRGPYGPRPQGQGNFRGGRGGGGYGPGPGGPNYGGPGGPDMRGPPQFQQDFQQGGRGGGSLPGLQGVDLHREQRTRQQQRCFRRGDPPQDEVVVAIKATEAVVVMPSGELVLSTGGYHNEISFVTINDALNPIGLKIKVQGNRISDGEWFVSDGGRYFKKFVDGMVIPKGIGSNSDRRAAAIFEALNDENRQLAALAAAASNAVAQRLGLQAKKEYKLDTGAPGAAAGAGAQGPQQPAPGGGEWAAGGMQ